MVDRSDLTMAPTGKTKKIKASNVAPPPSAGSTRYLWTLGGANDLADWTPVGSSRKTYGSGVDANGLPALIATVVQGDPAPTEWTVDGGTGAAWQMTVPCTFGDTARLAYNVSWVRTANSLTGPNVMYPSMMADFLMDESNEGIRVAHHFTMQPSGLTVDTLNTDVGYDRWVHGWAYQGAFYGHSNSGEMIVADPDATELTLEIQMGTIWANAAGVAALTAVSLELVPA
jgi:hypothetical protein